MSTYYDEVMDILKREKEMRMKVFKNKPKEFTEKVEEIYKVMAYIDTLRLVTRQTLVEYNNI